MLQFVMSISLVALLAGCGRPVNYHGNHVTQEFSPPAATASSHAPTTDQAASAPASSSDDPRTGTVGSASPASADSPQISTAHAAQSPERDEIIDITFDDLKLDMQLGTLFHRSMLTPRAAELDGQRVRLRGFIFAGGVFQQSGIKSFPFVMNTQCKFGPQGLAYCVMLVDLDEGVTTEFTTYPVTVEGRLTVRPYDAGGFTWSVYHMQGQRAD